MARAQLLRLGGIEDIVTDRCFAPCPHPRPRPGRSGRRPRRGRSGPTRAPWAGPGQDEAPWAGRISCVCPGRQPGLRRRFQPMGDLLACVLGVRSERLGRTLGPRTKTAKNMLIVAKEIAVTKTRLGLGLPLTEIAGAGGFEPSNGGSKGRCLTAWRRPIGSNVKRF